MVGEDRGCVRGSWGRAQSWSWARCRARPWAAPGAEEGGGTVAAALRCAGGRQLRSLRSLHFAGREMPDAAVGGAARDAGFSARSCSAAHASPVPGSRLSPPPASSSKRGLCLGKVNQTLPLDSVDEFLFAM